MWEGFFLDVGSGDGPTFRIKKRLSKRAGLALNRRFPKNMQDRAVNFFKEVVFSEAGQPVKFWAADDRGGIIDLVHPGDKMQK